MAPDDKWVVLAQHEMNPFLLSIDGTCIAMLGLENALLAEGIDVVFDPFRPGEGGVYTRSVAQPVRLLVHESQLDRAREVASELQREAERVADAECEAADDVPAKAGPGSPDSADSFEGWND